MTSPYQNFLFSEVRSAQDSNNFKHICDIVNLGLRMYPKEQILEYLDAIPLDTLKKLHDAPFHLQVKWHLPPEVFQHVKPEDLYAHETWRRVLHDEHGSIAAWEQLRYLTGSCLGHTNSRSFYLAVIRIWCDQGWLAYRSPTLEDLENLVRLWQTHVRHKKSNWRRVMHIEKGFTMQHPWIVDEMERAKILLKF